MYLDAERISYILCAFVFVAILIHGIRLAREF